MKKILAIVLAAALIFTLASCGKGGTEEPATTAAPVTDAPISADATAEELVGADYVDPVKGWDKYNELISQIKSSTDYAERVQLMHDAEDILMSNFCVIPIYYYNDIYLQKDYVDGIYSSLFGTKFFMYATMSNGATTLKLNLASEPDHLDPALNSSVDGACLAANSFSGLYTYNAEGKTEPACATGYEVSEDGLTYTVKLREGLKWSDGSDLTAEDFAYSWKRAVAPDTAADYAYMFAGFEGYDEETNDINVEAVDATTLKFVLTAPCAYMEDLMAFPTFFPVKKEAVEAGGDEPGAWANEAGFVSNGAYVCTGWNHETSMTYEKNPNWYDADKVTVEKLEFMLSADDTAIYAAYNAGNIDFADTVPIDEVKNLLDNPEFKIIDNLGTYYAAFNCKSDLFAGKTPAEAACMRKALCILIDRDYITENIGQTGQIAANSYIPLGMADGNGGVFKSDKTVGYFDAEGTNKDHAGTLETARTLLKAAGYKFGDDGKLSAETPLTLKYITNESTGHVAIAEAMQQDFAEIGIEMTIQTMDWNVFLNERKQGNFDFAREGWLADFNDPINMLEMWITNSGNNDCQYGRVDTEAAE